MCKSLRRFFLVFILSIPASDPWIFRSSKFPYGSFLFAVCMQPSLPSDTGPMSHFDSSSPSRFILIAEARSQRSVGARGCMRRRGCAPVSVILHMSSYPHYVASKGPGARMVLLVSTVLSPDEDVKIRFAVLYRDADTNYLLSVKSDFTTLTICPH